MKVVDRLVSGSERSIATLRRRFGWFEHAWLTKDRYGEVFAGRLAAAISYYGFFATFSLAMLGFAIFGFVLTNNEAIANAVTEWLEENLPFIDASQIQGSLTTVGVVGLVGFLLTGIGWVESMRSSIRAVWLLDQAPGNYFVRRGVDVLVLIGLGLLLLTAIGFSVGARSGIDWLRDHVEISHFFLNYFLNSLYVVTTICVNSILAAAMLTVLPRLRMPLARLLPAALLVAVGLELLKSVGQLFVVRTQNNPAYQFVIGAVGLLVFLNLFNQLLLWASAWAATSDRGTVRDLAVHSEDELPGGTESDSPAQA